MTVPRSHESPSRYSQCALDSARRFLRIRLTHGSKPALGMHGLRLQGTRTSGSRRYLPPACESFMTSPTRPTKWSLVSSSTSAISGVAEHFTLVNTDGTDDRENALVSD